MTLCSTPPPLCDREGAERLAKFDEPSAHAGLHRAERPSESLRDLGLRESVEVGQHERLALLARERRDCRTNAPRVVRLERLRRLDDITQLRRRRAPDAP